MLSVALLLEVLAGMGTGFQSPTNTALSRSVGNAQATLVNFTVGFVVLAVLTALFGSGSLLGFLERPLWQWIGGLYGVFFVIAITYASPVLGVALTLTAIMLGELACGMVVDSFGLLDVQVIAVTPVRVAGIGLVAAGVMTVYFGKVRGSGSRVGGLPSASEGASSSAVPSGSSRVSSSGKSEGSTGISSRSLSAASSGDMSDSQPKMQMSQPLGKSIGQPVFMLALSILAGVGMAIQAPTNAALAAGIGSMEASCVSFAGGWVAILLYSLSSNKGKLNSLAGVSPWKLTGGLYGSMVVLFTIIATPILGVGLAMSAVMLGQMTSGLVIDTAGLLQTQRIPLDRLRVVGIVLVAIGVVVVCVSKLAGVAIDLPA